MVRLVSSWLSLASVALASACWAQPAEPEVKPAPIRRPGSVVLDREYDLARLRIPMDEIHTLLPRDAIPALTDPATEPADEATWLPADARVLSVAIGGDALAVPLNILDFHEVVNTTVGGEPVAATYCPLCDSAAVFSRRVTVGEGDSAQPRVLEFGVSGALFNSNVLMYDRSDKALWSQLGMEAVSGPLAGTALRALPVEVITLEQFRREHPGSPIVSNKTGHPRDYGRSPYTRYMSSPDLLVPVPGAGDALPRKTLGVGVLAGDRAWFVPTDVIAEGYTLQTPAGPVRMERGPAGVAVRSAPEGVRTIQTFYYAWSAFNPGTEVVRPAGGG